MRRVADAFTVLVVCSANVCRSPVVETLLARRLADAGVPGDVSVQSAGWGAEPGTPACFLADDWLARPPGRVSVSLAGVLLESADLVLALDRRARGACAVLDPACRPRLFTLNQAAALAALVSSSLRSGATPDGAPRLPAAGPDRLRWLVGELDAARGLLAGRDAADDDIPDRHGPEPHDEVFAEAQAAVEPLAALLAWLPGTAPP